MANRAYLYSSNCKGAEDPPDWEELDRNSDTPYYDSRWNIPIAWLFFYHASDIRVIYKHGFLQIMLTAPKSEALATFKTRMPLISLKPNPGSGTPNMPTKRILSGTSSVCVIFPDNNGTWESSPPFHNRQAQEVSLNAFYGE